MKKPVSQRIYMHELKNAGYDLDAVLVLLKEGTITAKGRFNIDYTRDLGHPDPHERGHLEKVKPIPEEAWQDFSFDKKKFFLENENDQSSYDFISVDRAKLDKAIQGIRTGAGAPRKYNEERFYQELIVHVYEDGLPDTSHEKWCMALFDKLPYLQEFNEMKEDAINTDRDDMEDGGAPGPSLDWVKRRTRLIWDQLKSE